MMRYVSLLVLLAAMIMTVWDQAHRARMFTLSLRRRQAPAYTATA